MTTKDMSRYRLGNGITTTIVVFALFSVGLYGTSGIIGAWFALLGFTWIGVSNLALAVIGFTMAVLALLMERRFDKALVRYEGAE